MAGGVGVEERDVINRSPTQLQLGKMKAGEREAQETCEPEAQPLEQGAAEEVELPGTEERPVLSSQRKAVPSGQSQFSLSCPTTTASEKCRPNVGTSVS